VFVQGLAVVDQRRDHRHLDVGQFEGELVFFEDGFVGPALRTVELGDQRLGVFDADLIDAVLIAVERQNARVAEKPMLSTASSTRSGVRVSNGWAMLTPARSRLPRPAKHGSADGASLVTGLEVCVVWADITASKFSPTGSVLTMWERACSR
jgi:hypothetical protein